MQLSGLARGPKSGPWRRWRRRSVAAALVAAACVVAVPQRTASAGNRFDITTTWFQERRGSTKGVTVIHPQVGLDFNVGEHTTIGADYSADVVSGATPSVYSVDALSSATNFSDTRHAGQLSLGLKGHRSDITITGGAGVERDYTSIHVTAHGDVYLPGKNTELGLSYTHNFDHVCDRDNANRTPLEREALVGQDKCDKTGVLVNDTPGMTVWKPLNVDTVEGTVTQNLSPQMVLQVGVFGEVLRGFQSNPYRRVDVDGVEAQESVPDVRGRLAVFARLNRYMESLHGAVHFSARGYSDTWGVNSASFQMGYSQYVGDHLLFRLRGRVYQQTPATFFKDAYFYETEGPAGAYFTGDRELAPLRNFMGGGKLTFIDSHADGSAVWGLFDEVSINLKSDVYFFQQLAADSTADNPMNYKNEYLGSGQLFDAFTLELGILTRY